MTQNVLIMGYIEERELVLIDFQKVTLVVQSREIIVAIGALNQKIKVHLEINIGVNRWGINPS